MAQNEVEIVVRVRDQSKTGFAQAEQQGRTSGERAGRAFGDGVERQGRDALGRFTAGAKRDLDEVGDSARNAGNSAGGAAGGISLLSGHSGLLVVAALAAAAALQQLAGAALLLPGAIGAVVGIFGAFSLGLSGISDALGASGQKAGGAGTKIAAASHAVRDATRAVEAAKRSEERADRALADAHRGVERATQDYARALEDERRAQADVSRAREQATRDLIDLAEAQSDSVLDVEGAELALRRAQDSLIKTNRDRHATELDKAEALYAVKTAQERVSDSQTAAVDSSKALNDAQRKGVDGADVVVAAQQRLADAQDRTADAAQGIVDAQQSVADAEQNVADAHVAVSDAIENLNDALAAQGAAAAGAAGGVDKFAEALAKLSPNARAFVLTLLSLKDRWDAMQRSVQDRLFAGFSTEVRDLADVYLPVLHDRLGDIAGGLNAMAIEASHALLAPGTVSDVNDLLASTATFLNNAKHSLGDFTAGFLGLGEVGSRYLPRFGAYLDDIANKFRRWVDENSGAGGKIEEWIDRGIKAFQDLWDIAVNVGSFLSSIFTGLAGGEGGSGDFLGTINAITGALAEMAADPAVQGALTGIGFAIGLIIDGATTLGPILTPVLVALGLWAAAQWLVNIAMEANPIGAIILLILLLVGAFMYCWKNSETFRDVLTGTWNAIYGEAKWIIDGIVAAWSWLGDTISSIAGWISRTCSTMWDGLAAGARGAANAAIRVLNGLITAANGVVYGMNLINPFNDIPYIPYVSYLAKGGIAGGLAMVGERGAELVKLPQGSTVYPHGQSQNMLDKAARSGGDGGGGGLQLVVGAGGEDAIARMIMELVRTGVLQLEAAA